MAGLLAAQDGALAPQRLEHVPVAHVRRDDVDSALGHQPVEAHVRHPRHRHRVDPARECDHGDDLVAVERLARLVDGEDAVAVAVERDAEVVVATTDDLRQERQVGRAAAGVDVGAVGRIRRSPSPPRRGARTLPGRCSEKAPLAQSTAIRRPLRSAPNRSSRCATYPRRRPPHARRRPARRRGIEQRLDRQLVVVRELLSRAVEELDAVVLGRVVRGGDHRAEVLAAINATAGVGSTPASTAMPPAETIPRASASSSSGPSHGCPARRAPGRGPTTAWRPCRAAPRAPGVSVSPTTPRTPSVPKNSRARLRSGS